MKSGTAFPPPDAPSPDSLRHVHGFGDMEQRACATDMDVRAGLCTALTDLSGSMRSLLGLMARHNFITTVSEHNFPAYVRIMERIGTAVTQATAEVERSHELDRRILLAEKPTATLFRQ